MALGEILPDQSVGVLVGASLPAMVRRREVELHLTGLFDLLLLILLLIPLRLAIKITSKIKTGALSS